jgi:uracil-DNA glycosylase family 4
MTSRSKQQLLNEMGITVWRERGIGSAPLASDAKSATANAPGSAAGPLSTPIGGPGRVLAGALDKRATPAAAPEQAQASAIGAHSVTATPEAPSEAAEGLATSPVRTPDRAAVQQMGWTALQDAVSACEACGLHRTRNNTVFGVGNHDAPLLIIGEAPGQNEDLQGEPFVGRAGQLLNAMLEAIGFGRDDVYIANTVKCRPPGNRDPRSEETAHCSPYLERQIELLNPGAILAVGRIAAHILLSSTAPLGKLRGQVHHYQGSTRPLIVTYHPAYLLRSPAQKRNAWKDLLLAKRTLSEARQGNVSPLEPSS